MNSISDEKIMRLIINYNKHKVLTNINSKKYHIENKDNEEYKKMKNERAKSYYNNNKDNILTKKKDKRLKQKEEKKAELDKNIN